jgi:hypothetical protein
VIGHVHEKEQTKRKTGETKQVEDTWAAVGRKAKEVRIRVALPDREHVRPG